MPGGGNPADRVDASAGLASTLGGLNLGATEGGSSSREPGPSSSSVTAAGGGGRRAVTAPSADRPGLLTCQVLSCLATTGKKGAPLLTCTGCRYVAYCCKDHQKLDWSLHKLFCKNVGKDGPLAPVVPKTEWMTAGMNDEQRDRWHAAKHQLDSFCGMVTPAQHAAFVVRAKAMLSDLEAFFGRGHLGTVNALETVRGIFVSKGMYDDALSYSLRALKIVEDSFGPDDTRTAYYRHGYASVIKGMGRIVEALVQYERCLKILESAIGLNSKETAISLNNIASVLSNLGRDNEAVPLIRRSLAIKTALAGAANYSDELAASRTNLADMLSKLGRFDEARPLFEAALDSTEMAEGRNSVNYARISSQYAIAMRRSRQGDPAMILEMLEHATTVLETTFGERDLSFISSLSNCAQANADLGRWRRAADQMDRCTTLTSDGEIINALAAYLRLDLFFWATEYGPAHEKTKEAQDFAARLRTRR